MVIWRTRLCYKSFSGFGGSLDDLWRYDPLTNQWTWINGSQLVEQPAVHGQIGISADTNSPGGRYEGVSWTDSGDNLWLFGGAYFHNNTNSGTYNDLWKYSLITHQWTWIKGANTINQPGVYGSSGVGNPANTPGAKQHSVMWKDAEGNFWLGGGIDQSNLSYNDLWKYELNSNQWAWVHGANTTNQVGTYGILQVPTAMNKPGARHGNVSWSDGMGNFWQFGGLGFADINSRGYLNDLWKLSNVSVLPLTLTSIRAYEQGADIKVEWEMDNESGVKRYDVEKSSDGMKFKIAGVQVATGNNNLKNFYLFRDESPSGGNNFYRICTVAENGDTRYSQIIKVSIGKGNAGYVLYPNPVLDGTIQLQFINQPQGVYKLIILNVLGQVAMINTIFHQAGSSTETIQLNHKMSKGKYTLDLVSPDKTRHAIKFIL